MLYGIWALLVGFGTWLINTALIRFVVGGLFGGLIKLGTSIGILKLVGMLVIGTVSYTGVGFSLDWVTTNINAKLATLPAWQYEILSMVGSNLYVDEILTVIFTAFATVLALWTFKGAFKMMSGVA